MLVKFTEVVELGINTKCTLRTLYVNSNHVVSIRENERMKQRLTEGHFPEDMDQNHEFTRLVLNSGGNSSHITVVGAVELIGEQLFGPHGSKTLLKG